MSSDAPSYSVLIVEDEFFIADDLARALRRKGMATLGPVADPIAAMATINGAEVDFAVVDINLDGAISFKVAAELRRREIPFLFLTGYDTSVVPAEFGDAVLLQKPSDSDVIVAEIERQAVAPH